MKLLLPILVVLTVIFTHKSYSQDVGHSSLPARSYLVGEEMLLNGYATRRRMNGNPIYTSALYLKDKSSDSEQIMDQRSIKRSVVIFHMDIPMYIAKKVFLEDLFINMRKEELKDIFPIVRKFIEMSPENGFMQHDELRFDFLPGEGTKIYLNSVEMATIVNPEFYNAILSQWIGPFPITREFKNAMLGVAKQKSSAIEASLEH
ncbi:chalcone isomerase family protein [Marinobacter sp. 71-i]|uniref:Chalcone isomerase family protein n=1 Tax=Marinobacter iranensis TaxID=2962607 RepID=A0ABT5YHQ6_9GAMM|nr:chalcone isomerase family protein [Marinobacter iranensis]MDF0752575.1 chalcone isomerase family protein [Marinobacter iranensis]